MALFARVGINVSLFSNNCCSKLIFNGTKLKIFERSSKFMSFGRSFSDRTAVVSHNSNYVQFEKVLSQRQEEAGRSILVEIRKMNSCEDVYIYCSQFGDVRGMYHYQLQSQHFVLVEFNKHSSVDSVLSKAIHKNIEDMVILPVNSTMFRFKNSSSTKQTMSNLLKKQPSLKKMPLRETYGCQTHNDNELANLMKSAKSVSDQMLMFYEVSKLSETDVRLRFHTANQLERCFSGIFPNIHVLPFGSSVNGFGKQGCDLDLVLDLDSKICENSNSMFVYHTKMIQSNERRKAELCMNALAGIMEQFLPGISNVRRILKARVPIIKYYHSFTNVECDFSMMDMTGVHMAELLYLYGEIDSRVKPLVFVVRKWAQSIGLTNNSPGRWIKNFYLTLMVIFYLQRKGVLPSLNILKKHARKSDVRLNSTNVDSIFLRDLSRLPKRKYNIDSLQSLLQDFFEVYSLFDYSHLAISLSDGEAIPKPSNSALYICNPLNHTMNVSQNVTIDEVQRLQIALGNATQQLQSTNYKTQCWGLLSIFNIDTEKLSVDTRKTKIDVSSIFKLEEDSKILFEKENNVEDSIIMHTSNTHESTVNNEILNRTRRR